MSIPELYIGDILINNGNTMGLSKFSKKEVYKYIDTTDYHNDFNYVEILGKMSNRYIEYKDSIEIIYVPINDSFLYYIFKNTKLDEYYISDAMFLNCLFSKCEFNLDMKHRRLKNIDKLLEI